MPKKAISVSLDLNIRVIIEDTLDPELDHEEFDKILLKALKKKLEEPNPESYLGENISTYQDDTQYPYDPEFD